MCVVAGTDQASGCSAELFECGNSWVQEESVVSDASAVGLGSVSKDVKARLDMRDKECSLASEVFVDGSWVKV
jgi:hypothetical protein